MRAHVAGIVVVATLALVACGGDAPPPSGSGRGPFGVAAPPPSTGPGTTASAHGHHTLDSFDHDSFEHPAAHVAVRPPPSAGADGVPPPPGSTTGEGERNLQTELVTALGSPATCLDTATARTLHGRLTLQVTANVTPSGNVTRATVSGSSVPESVITCMQARAMSVHLAAPIEGAPRAISTSLAFEVTTTDDTRTTETPVWHQPGQVAEPGVVLSAGGTEGRPQGAVAPDSTLPAAVTTGRPEGAVAPDIVLPARGR
jgi:hypothetical protein